jgi:hypothetical protein
VNYSVAAILVRDIADKLSRSSEKGLCCQDTAAANKTVLKILLQILSSLESKHESTGWKASNRIGSFAVTSL